MALKKITGKDFKEAVDWLLKEKQGCVHQVLGTTNDGTELCFVVGWSKGTDYGDDDKKYGYFDEGYCISAKIGYQHRNNAMQTDYDWDFNMPYDLETGDVWDTSSYVPRDADWEREAADYNKEAEKIWAAYGDPDGKNFWDDDKAPLDLMESKKSSEAKKHTCSMQKKKESLSKKKSESDYGAFDWTVGVSYLENGTGEAVKDVYLIKAHNMNSAKEQAILRANRKGSDAHVYSCKLGKHIYGEAKKPACSMQNKKESLLKKSESVPFKLTEFPKELKQLRDACSKKLISCDDELSSAMDVSSGKDGVSSAHYVLKGTYGEYADVKAILDYDKDEGFTVTIKGLDETTGYSWVVLGEGKSTSFKDALFTAVSEFDKNISTLVNKIRKAMGKSEAKKPVCSMQKKKESLAKKTEMVRPEDPDELKVGKYTADVLTADGEFILSLPAFYDDVAETVKAAKDCLQENSDYVKDTGLVPSKIHVTTVVAKRGWNMPQFVKDVDLNATEAKKPVCSMQKKKESLSAKKSEAYGDFNISDEDVKLTVNYVDVDSHGGSFSVDTPKDGQSYSLQEMKDMVKGMCEDCSGYADISRDGSDILIMVMAPETDENGEFANDYYAAYTVRCTVRIISTSLETFVDYLDKYNAE